MDKCDIYVQEVKTQVEFAKRSYSAFRDAEKARVTNDVFYYLHHFLVHATLIDNILRPASGTPRHAILAARSELSAIDLRPFRSLRNHLIHFDERLDDWVRKNEGRPFFDMNIRTGARGFPNSYSLRSLDGNTFWCCGESYDMVQLHAAILEIERRLLAITA